jgi:hypothetical protein
MTYEFLSHKLVNELWAYKILFVYEANSKFYDLIFLEV